MSEFDEYWKDYEISSDYVNSRYSCAEDAYLAGQQSQQGEVDKLQTEIDELQARVDKVVHILTYTNHASTPLCNELRDILKGNKDEN